MSLKLHNTLTGQKDDFIPLDPNRITLYVRPHGLQLRPYR